MKLTLYEIVKLNGCHNLWFNVRRGLMGCDNVFSFRWLQGNMTPASSRKIHVYMYLPWCPHLFCLLSFTFGLWFGCSDILGVCTACGERVVGEGSGCTAMDQVYHISCFTCQHCAIQLQGKPFYALEGKPYCEEDYLVSAIIAVN